MPMERPRSRATRHACCATRACPQAAPRGDRNRRGSGADHPQTARPSPVESPRSHARPRARRTSNLSTAGMPAASKQTQRPCRSSANRTRKQAARRRATEAVSILVHKPLRSVERSLSLPQGAQPRTTGDRVLAARLSTARTLPRAAAETLDAQRSANMPRSLVHKSVLSQSSMWRVADCAASSIHRRLRGNDLSTEAFVSATLRVAERGLTHSVATSTRRYEAKTASPTCAALRSG